MAAAQHRLDSATLAAFILAEQRDQSRNEDAADYGGATPMLQRNSSIGLGQVVVSTARREDLFEKLLDLPFRRALTHNEIASLLASDEFNIFAVAKYIRVTADRASRMTAVSLPGTVEQYPEIDFGKYSDSSREWPADNVRALGSEYTSTPWDDRLVPAWGEFVYQALRDIRAAGVRR